MKALVIEKYGSPDVFQVKDIPKPVPSDEEVLVKIHAAAVTKYDCWVRSCTAPPGFKLLMRLASGLKPKLPVIGTEFSGEIEKTGKNVRRLNKGDLVFGFTGMKLGAYAEYISLPAKAVVKKPNNASSEEAATILQGALTALYFLREANIQKGQKVLIFGASGGVGSYAVQLAKHLYGAHVTGVCSREKMEYVRSLGADRVIDYAVVDFTQNGRIYDVVFDTVGKTSVRQTRKALSDNGSYLLATFSLGMALQVLWLSKTSRLNLFYGTLEEKTEDLIKIRELVESDRIKVVLDRSYPIEQADQAHAYVESGQKMGGVALTMR